MQEIISHDKPNVENFNSSRWSDLELIADRVKTSTYSKISDMTTRLNLESTSPYYESIYFVDEEGYTYSNSGKISKQDDIEPVNLLIKNYSHYAILYRGGNVIEHYIDYLTYGVTFEPFTVEGRKIIGIYALCEYDSVTKQLKISSFSNQGTTFIFDSNGYFIVQKDAQPDIGNRPNIYTMMVEESGLTDKEIDDIKDKIFSSKSFLREFKPLDSETHFIYFAPIDDVEWTICLSVSYSAISQTTIGFVGLALSLLGITVIGFID